jgi:hypothetical protein
MAEGPEKKAAKKAAKKATSAKKAAPAKKAGAAKKKAAPAKKALSSSKKAAPAPTKRKPEHQEIAEHAYHIHEREGGDAVENWLRAERELSDS